MPDSQTEEEWFGSSKNQHLKDNAGSQTAEKGVVLVVAQQLTVKIKSSNIIAWKL